MNESTNKTDYQSIGYITDAIQGMAQKKVEAIEANIYQEAKTLRETATYRLAGVTTSLTPYISTLTLRANYGLIRVTLHASPEIFALIMTFVTLAKIIRWVVTVFNVIKFLGTIWRINQIILSIWPQYKRWWDELMVKVSNLSEALGWGVDGIIHVYNAVNMGVHITGRLLGKSWDMLQIEGMEKSVEMAQKISRIFEKLQDNPSAFLDDVLKIEMYKTGDNVRQWLWEVTNTISKGLEIGEAALKDAQTAINELSSIQRGMPEIIRENIPQSIWDGLQRADNLIHDNILPRFTLIQNSLTFLNRLHGVTINRLGELARKLASPGDLLLGVDDLQPAYKKLQEGMIDDVTSRDFNFWADTERVELQGDIREFERVKRLMEAPTPQPSFMAIEIPRGVTLRGITAEPHETWFIGGYNDSH